MRETRLYYKDTHQQAYERFETVRLATDEALLKRFVFLLGAERVVPAHRESHLYELLPRLRNRRARPHQPVLRPLR